MCLNVHKDLYKKNVAKENIPCYKGHKNESFYKGKKYKLIDESGVLDIPFHSGTFFTWDGMAPLKNSNDRGFRDYHEFNKGLHSHIPKAARFFERNFLFIIPKGAKYIEGCGNGYTELPECHDNYISDQIIYLGRNNWFNRLIAKIFYGVDFESN